MFKQLMKHNKACHCLWNFCDCQIPFSFALDHSWKPFFFCSVRKYKIVSTLTTASIKSNKDLWILSEWFSTSSSLMKWLSNQLTHTISDNKCNHAGENLIKINTHHVFSYISIKIFKIKWSSIQHTSKWLNYKIDFLWNFQGHSLFSPWWISHILYKLYSHIYMNIIFLYE